MPIVGLDKPESRMTASGCASRMTPAACSTSAAYSSGVPAHCAVLLISFSMAHSVTPRAVALDQGPQELVVLVHVGRSHGRRLALGARPPRPGHRSPSRTRPAP